jgi:hypothetical protein
VQNAVFRTKLRRILRPIRPRPVLAVLIAAGVAAATPANAAPETCDAAAARAAAEHGVPVDLMWAITRAETGQQRDGAFRPWPWAVNEGGRGKWFDSRIAAETYARQAVDAGVRNIDIGCFQLNFRWHGHAFASVSDMFDPIRNARHAAAFLADLQRQTGDWQRAAGAYHSRTPELAERYAARVEALRGKVSGQPVAPARQVAVNAFPLLQPGGPASSGSLVPGLGAARPLLVGAPSRLIGS